MINLLWLSIILIVETALLWVLYKLFGKVGIIAFSVFAVIQAEFQATLNLSVGTIPVVSSLVSWMPLLLALVFLLHKYGTKTGVTFLIATAGTLIATVLGDKLLAFANGVTIDVLDVFLHSGATLFAVILEVILAMIMFELFKGVKINTWLKLMIILAILVVFDVILFIGIFSIGSLSFKGILALMLSNLWQKGIVFALFIPVMFGFLKTKSIDLEGKIRFEDDVQTEPENKVEIAVEAPKGTVKKETKAKTVAKKPATKKTVAKTPAKKVVKAPAKKAVAKKTAVKKATAKKTK